MASPEQREQRTVSELHDVVLDDDMQSKDGLTKKKGTVVENAAGDKTTADNDEGDGNDLSCSSMVAYGFPRMTTVAMTLLVQLVVRPFCKYYHDRLL